MSKKSSSELDPERVLASLSPDTMDRLADLVVAKLKGISPCSLLPKQGAVGSNPITRSIEAVISELTGQELACPSWLPAVHTCTNARGETKPAQSRQARSKAELARKARSRAHSPALPRQG